MGKAGLSLFDQGGFSAESIQRYDPSFVFAYRAYAGLERAPAWLRCASVLEVIGRGSLKRQRLAYLEYVEGAVREGLQQSPWEELAGQVLLGGSEFLERMRSRLVGN